MCMLCAHMPSNMFVYGDDHDAYEGESEYEHSHRDDCHLEDVDESDVPHGLACSKECIVTSTRYEESCGSLIPMLPRPSYMP